MLELPLSVWLHDGVRVAVSLSLAVSEELHVLDALADPVCD